MLNYLPRLVVLGLNICSRPRSVVGCGWSLYQLAGQYKEHCLDSVVATSSGPDIGHGEPPASASSVKVNVATCITACEYTLFYQSLCFFSRYFK